MSDHFIDSYPVRAIADLTYTMWEKGWDESNGGNVSYILSSEELEQLEKETLTNEKVEVLGIPENMIGKHILITASGSQFRTLKDHLPTDVGVIKVVEDGYIKRWGFKGSSRPTSELYMHLLSHNARLEIDSSHRVVVHNHASNATAYSLISEPNDRAYTLPLWKVLTESIVVFPDGVGVLPWQLPGTLEIGKNTAEKLKKTRIVVWTFHGILATGSSFQDCFGLIETVDKAAKIYMDTLNIKNYEGLSEENILEVCKSLNIEPRKEILNLNVSI